MFQQDKQEEGGPDKGAMVGKYRVAIKRTDQLLQKTRDHWTMFWGISNHKSSVNLQCLCQAHKKHLEFIFKITILSIN